MFNGASAAGLQHDGMSELKSKLFEGLSKLRKDLIASSAKIADYDKNLIVNNWLRALAKRLSVGDS